MLPRHLALQSGAAFRLGACVCRGWRQCWSWCWSAVLCAATEIPLWGISRKEKASSMMRPRAGVGVQGGAGTGARMLCWVRGWLVVLLLPVFVHLLLTPRALLWHFTSGRVSPSTRTRAHAHSHAVTLPVPSACFARFNLMQTNTRARTHTCIIQHGSHLRGCRHWHCLLRCRAVLGRQGGFAGSGSRCDRGWRGDRNARGERGGNRARQQRAPRGARNRAAAALALWAAPSPSLSA